jgi:N-acetylglutamate synthase-like GNAT family acetyltransferase
MMTLLLRHKGRAVCVAVLRVFGPQLAELPLVATRPDARRQGHAKVLVSALEALLSRMGVRCLALPAAHEAEKTWVEGFHFEYMPEKQQEQVGLLWGSGAALRHVQGAAPRSSG